MDDLRRFCPYRSKQQEVNKVLIKPYTLRYFQLSPEVFGYPRGGHVLHHYEGAQEDEQQRVVDRGEQLLEELIQILHLLCAGEFFFCWVYFTAVFGWVIFKGHSNTWN